MWVSHLFLTETSWLWLCRWTLQGLAYVELSGHVFDPPGCVAEGMPGASADDLRQVRSAWMHQTVGDTELMRACAWMLKTLPRL